MKYLVKIAIIILAPIIIGKTVYLGENSQQETDTEFTSNLYPDHIAGAYTGGFGEQSCHSCHFDYDLNQPEGKLSVSGLDEPFKSGQKYTIQLTVKREDLKRAGFQMTVRFEDGTQAGKFEMAENLTTTPNIEGDVSYLQHGVGQVDAENGKKVWHINWVAPDRVEPVIFNIAANAANGDASEFGDWIYLKEIQLNPKNDG